MQYQTEYEKKQDAEEACKGMNGFDLGGFFLRVGIAITPPSRHYEMVWNCSTILINNSNVAVFKILSK